MKRRLIVLYRLLRGQFLDENGQAVTEYASITFLLLTSAIAAGASWPVWAKLFQYLQVYIDLYFYALNVAVG